MASFRTLPAFSLSYILPLYQKNRGSISLPSHPSELSEFSWAEIDAIDATVYFQPHQYNQQFLCVFGIEFPKIHPLFMCVFHKKCINHLCHNLLILFDDTLLVWCSRWGMTRRGMFFCEGLNPIFLFVFSLFSLPRKTWWSTGCIFHLLAEHHFYSGRMYNANGKSLLTGKLRFKSFFTC